MEENKTSNFQSESNLVENADGEQGLRNFRRGSSNSPPGPFNSYSGQSSPCSHVSDQDRIPKLSGKRSPSENEDLGRDNKLIKLSGKRSPSEDDDLDRDNKLIERKSPDLLKTEEKDVIVPIFNNREPIRINRAVLTPPPPGFCPRYRSKPPGCKTVFVGNLPEKITEEIVREAFKIFGPITMVRMGKQRYCFIRYANMKSVDQAICLAGFRIRIDESDDLAFNNTIYVDYAVTRADFDDYNKKLRIGYSIASDD